MRCAYILAMINYRNNPVEDIGLDSDASIVKDEDEKLYTLVYAVYQEKQYFWGIRWLIQNRHANIHQKDHNGFESRLTLSTAVSLVFIISLKIIRNT